MKSNEFRDNLDLANFLFQKTMDQYKRGLINSSEYKETLFLILEKINNAELEFKKIAVIKTAFNTNLEVNVKETIMLAYSMN